MRRGILMAVVLLAGQALASWRSYDAGASVREVVAPDGGEASGVAVVSTGLPNTAFAVLVQSDGGEVAITPVVSGANAFAGAGLFGADCLVALTSAGAVQFSTGACGTNYALASAADRLRVTPSGQAWAVQRLLPTGTTDFWISRAPSAAGPFTAVGPTLTVGQPPPFDVAPTSAGDVAAMYDVGGGNQLFAISGGSVVSVGDAGVIRGLAVTDLGAAPAVVASTSGAAGVYLYRLGNTIPAVASSAPPAGTAAALAFTTNGGNAQGSGFGLLVTTDGGLWSPVPDPARPADQWVRRPEAAPGFPVSARVNCANAAFCVLVGPGPTQFSAYFNESPPVVSVPTVAVTEGQPTAVTPVTSDADGDPVHLECSSPAATAVRAGASWTVTPTVGTACGASVTLTCTGSDGWAPHVRSAFADLPLTRTAGPGTPSISGAPASVTAGAAPVGLTATAGAGCPPSDFRWTSSTGQTGTGATLSWQVPGVQCVTSRQETVSVAAVDAVDASVPATVTVTVLPTPPRAPVVSPPGATIPAGSGSVTFTAAQDGGCPATDYRWTSPDGGTSAGSTFTFTAPDTFCSADAGVVTLDVVAVDQLDASVATRVNIVLEPWGRPNPPVFPVPAQQLAGTDASWLSTDVPHACSTTNGFPGTDLRWVFDGGLPGVTATPIDGGLFLASSDRCISGQYVATAYRRVLGTSQPEAPGVLAVAFLPDIGPLSAGTTFSMGFTLDASSASIGGTFTTNASCPTLRGLCARVEVSRDGGVLVPSQACQPVPGPWTVAIPDGCNGGDFVARAELFADGGTTTTGLTEEVPFQTNVLGAAPGAVTPETLPVRCGEGGGGGLVVSPAPGSCAAAGWSWRQLDGPLLDGGLYAGAQIDVRTVDLGFEAVGQAVRFEITADAGGANVATAVREVRFVTEPFLEISERVVPLPVREEEGLDVLITLYNPTVCAVSGLEARVALGDLTAVDGTVRLDGAPLTATVGSGELRVPGVSVPAGERALLRFRARMPLLGRPSVTTGAFLNDVKVSVDRVAPPGGGCGCGSAPGGTLALLLLGLALVRSRRRFG